MTADEIASQISKLNQRARPLTGRAEEYDALLDLIGDARFVLLGEASHGTHEFYRERARITRRLIEEKGFNAIAVEADWPDAYLINRYVRGYTKEGAAIDALSGFKRFPRWMWRNADVLDFVGWLREHNERRPAGTPGCGFYGLDLYSLHSSIEAVLDYLAKVDPEAASRARYRYSCFDHFGEDSQSYGYAASFGMTGSCEEEVIKQLVELRRHAAEYARRDGRLAEEEYFFAEQNARLVKNAEEYYRSMFSGRVQSWNLRDQHMVETLESLATFLEQQEGYSRIVVWAHNSHLGDARATEMGQRGEWNLGQLTRERLGRDETVNIGFTTYTGTVTAASDWGDPAERKVVRPALPDSYEALFHRMEPANFMLDLRDPEVAGLLRKPRLERAIGVIYRPETERLSHYFHASLPEQFDVLLHFDETRALEPLERTPAWEAGEDLPETYPYSV